MEDDDGLTQVHCVIPKVYVFQIPANSGSVSTGYSARDWPKKALWSGRLRVLSKGKEASVVLEHIDRDGVFAVCPYKNKSAVEQVNDSSRYFVIRVEQAGGGRAATVGIGFKERNEAFDFRIALQDTLKQSSNKAEQYMSSLPSQNFSLAAGETIHVNIGGKAEHKAAAAPVGGPIMKLSAPGTKPKKKGKRRKKKVIGPEPVGTRTPVTRLRKPQTQAAPAASPAAAAPAAAPATSVEALTDDLFGMSMDAPAQPAAAAAQPAPAAAASSDNPFDMLDF